MDQFSGRACLNCLSPVRRAAQLASNTTTPAPYGNPWGIDSPPRTDGGDGSGGGGCECEQTVFTPLKLLILMLLKVKDTSVMLREGGTPGGSNLRSSSVKVAPRPTRPLR